MKLIREDADLFFKLMWGLQFFVKTGNMGRCVLRCLIIPVTIIPIFQIKVLSVLCEKFWHDGEDTLLAAFKEEMDVTVHKYPA